MGHDVRYLTQAELDALRKDMESASRLMHAELKRRREMKVSSPR